METVQACLSLRLSKCHIVGNHMSRDNYILGFMRVFEVYVLTSRSRGAMEMYVTCDRRIPLSILTCYTRRLNRVVARNTNGVVFLFCIP